MKTQDIAAQKQELKDRAAKLGLYVYDWPMTAAGAGTILYQRTDIPNLLLVGVSSRSLDVGAGKGITAGGYGEVKDVLAPEVAVGTVFPLTAEAWRETIQEIPGVEKIIDERDFLENAQPLVSFMVRTPDSSMVHCSSYLGYEVTLVQRIAVEALPPSDETTAPVKFTGMRWPRRQPGKLVLPLGGPLFHSHEREAFAALARLADKDRLWRREG